VQTVAADDEGPASLCFSALSCFLVVTRPAGTSDSGRSLPSLGLRPRLDPEIPSFSAFGVTDEEEEGRDSLSDGKRMSLSGSASSSKAGPFHSAQLGSSPGCSGASQSLAASSHRITLIHSCQTRRAADSAKRHRHCR